MKRVKSEVRKNWKETCEKYGFNYHTIDNEKYWDESVYYEFTSDQIDDIDDSTNELHRMCLEAVDTIIHTDKYLSQFSIPDWVIPYIKESWSENESSMYGRFDFSYDGVHPPKMLEYNADTPTSLLEASIVQWFWKEEVKPKYDQFNSIQEKLEEFWENYDSEYSSIYLSSMKDSDEDYGNIAYIKKAIEFSGKEAELIAIEDIGFNPDIHMFVDLEEKPIDILFKLYPWEWMVNDAFGKTILDSNVRVIEPIWKMLLSNKAILPVLWDMFPGHKNLLPAYFDSSKLKTDYVIKPKLSREGENITIKTSTETISSKGSYNEKDCIYQEVCKLPEFGGNYPVIGSWIINNEAAGIGIREDSNLITKNTSRFVPHVFS